MQVVLEEARESYRAEVVHEVPSNTVEDAECNATRVEQWYRQWIVEHPAGVPS
jgi:adenylate kinase